MFVLTEDYKNKIKTVLTEPNFIEGSGKTSKELFDEFMSEYKEGEKDVAKIQTSASAVAPENNARNKKSPAK